MVANIISISLFFCSNEKNFETVYSITRLNFENSRIVSIRFYGTDEMQMRNILHPECRSKYLFNYLFIC
ncbi:TATA-box-binding protein [Dirofilaria immitis]